MVDWIAEVEVRSPVLMSVLEWTQEKLDDLECFAHYLVQDMGNILDLSLLKEDSVNKQV